MGKHQSQTIVHSLLQYMIRSTSLVKSLHLLLTCIESATECCHGHHSDLRRLALDIHRALGKLVHLYVEDATKLHALLKDILADLLIPIGSSFTGGREKEMRRLSGMGIRGIINSEQFFYMRNSHKRGRNHPKNLKGGQIYCALV